MSKTFLSLCCVLILSFTVCADESLIQIKQKLERIERDITDLQIVVFTKKDKQSTIDSGKQDVTSKITVFDMRLRDIENELQAINLHYENISFEIEDLKKALENLAFDLDNAIIELNNVMITITASIDSNSNINSENINVLELNESDGEVQAQTEQKNTLGTLKINSNDLSESNNIDITEEKISYSSPEEQFQAAFDNLRSQKFKKAKSDLELFIKEHASHNLAGSAHYWLGEIYLLQKEYREASLVFAEGYQKYPESVKSPESLYKLAETLTKIEKKDEACNILNQFVLKYPNNKLIDKTKSRINDLQCS